MIFQLTAAETRSKEPEWHSQLTGEENEIWPNHRTRIDERNY